MTALAKSNRSVDFSETAFAGLSLGMWTALVALAAFALYLPALGYDLVYDSHAQILIDDFIHQPRHFIDVLTLRVMGMDALDFNRPLNLFTLLVDSQLWGKIPAGYHLTSLLLHSAAAALLFRWLFSLVHRIAPALLGALFFAAHPLQCEAVVEVGNREDLLAVVFMLGGFVFASAFMPGHKNAWKMGIGAALCFFFSIASKESGVAGPASLAVYWFLFRRRDKFAHRSWLLLLAATSVAVVAFLCVRFALEPKNSIIFTSEPAPIVKAWPSLPSWPAFCSVQTRIWTAEWARIFWPSGLCADYTGESLRPYEGGVSLLAVAVALLLTGVLAWLNRLAALALAVFWFSLLPVSNFIPIFHPMADRFLYMPLVGVSLMIAAGFASLREPQIRLTACATGTAGLLALAALTAQQERIWRDDLSLWSATVETNPASWCGWLGLGWAWMDKNRPDKAREAFERALNLSNARDAHSFGALALAAEALGQHREAAEYLKKAAALDARYGEPETLVRAIVLEPFYAQRLCAIRSRHVF